MKNKAFSMRRLIFYELRKSFLNPWMLVFFAVLMIFNGFKVASEYKDRTNAYSEYQTVYDEFYDKWSGDITTENITEFMEIYTPIKNKFPYPDQSYDPNSYTYNINTDYIFFTEQFYNQMHYSYMYRNDAYEIYSRASSLARFYESIGNTYEMSKNIDIANRFRGRVVSDFSHIHAAEVWLNYDYSALLVILLCLFGLCPMFVTERETDMYMLLRTTKSGNSATVCAKLIASLLYIVVVCLLFFGEDYLILMQLSEHPEILNSPIYAIRYFESTPLNMTIGQYWLWASAVKTLGFIALGSMVLFISCLCKRVLSTFISSFAAVMVLIVLQEFCRTHVSLKWFNPIELIMVRDIVAITEYVNVFGLAVPLYAFVLGGVLLTSVIVFVEILLFNPGRAKRGYRHA